MSDSIIRKWKDSLAGDVENPAGMIELDDLDIAGGDAELANTDVCTQGCSVNSTSCCNCNVATACCGKAA